MPAGREGEVLVQSGSMTSPVDSRRNRRRSSRYSWPRARAAVTSVEPPVARSCSSSPSSTLIVVSNDPRIEPFSCSQFQPPSAICSVEQPVDDALHVLAEVGADRDGRAVDARLDLAVEERQVVVLPAAVLADERDRPADAGLGRVEPEDPQQHQGRLRAGPFGEVRAAAPAGRRRAGGRAAARPSPRGDPRALGGDDVGRLVEQVAHHLPADRGSESSSQSITVMCRSSSRGHRPPSATVVGRADIVRQIPDTFCQVYPGTGSAANGPLPPETRILIARRSRRAHRPRPEPCASDGWEHASAGS